MDSRNKTNSSCRFLRPHLKKQFFQKKILLFSFLTSRMSRKMCKLRHRVRNGKNLPHESPNFENFHGQFRPFFHNPEISLPK